MPPHQKNKENFSKIKDGSQTHLIRRVKNMIEKRKTMSIKNSLLKQLKGQGANVEHFISLINDYCWYESQEKTMQEDILTKGRMISSLSSTGLNIEKENPDVKYAMLYNKQKLSILKELGLTTKNVLSDEDDKL